MKQLLLVFLLELLQVLLQTAYLYTVLNFQKEVKECPVQLSQV
jgi:hypothetical protein